MFGFRSQGLGFRDSGFRVSWGPLQGLWGHVIYSVPLPGCIQCRVYWLVVGCVRMC